MKLHVEGRYIKDEIGNKVFLRGVNWGGYNLTTQGAWTAIGDTASNNYLAWDDSKPRAHYDTLRQWKANAMRWTLCIQYWKENRNNYRQYIRRGIELAQEYGIYIILAPWRVPNATYWENDPMPFPPYTTYSNIIADQQAFIDFWLEVANYLKDLPNWVIDPWNEPFSSGDHSTDRAIWFDTIAKLIPAIRSVTDHIVLVQWETGMWYGGVYSKPSAWVNDFISHLEQRVVMSNIVISTHTYRNNFAYDYNTLLKQWTDNGLYNATLNYPVIMGEIGADDYQTGTAWEQEKTWFNNAFAVLNLWEISYCAWTWARTGDRKYTLLQSGAWVPPPNEAGQILINTISQAPPAYILTVKSNPSGVPFTIRRL